MPVTDRPSLRARVLVALAVAALAAVLVTVVGRGQRLDVDQLWHGARALLGGRDPYQAVGPGLAFDFPWHLGYPATALLAVAPLAALPLLVARALFAALGAGALAYALTRDGWERLPVLGGGAVFMAVTAGQWSPLLMAATLLPGLAWVAAAKPNIGGALVLATLRPRVMVVAFVGGVALLLASLALDSGWPAAWLAAHRAAGHFRAPVQHWMAGGPLVLLAALRWRRPEARVLLAMALTPHTTLVYEAAPLALVARTRGEALALALLSWVAWALQWRYLPPGGPPYPPGLSFEGSAAYASYVGHAGDVVLWLCYLPCLAMVLRRPNEGPSLAGWLAWRGRSAGVAARA